MNQLNMMHEMTKRTY